MCILTFLLPVLAGIALNMLSGVSFRSISETSFGIVQDNLSDETAAWLQSNGCVTQYETRGELEEAVSRVKAIVVAEHSRVSQNVYKLIEKYKEEV